MQAFIYTVQLPENICNERVIKSVETKPKDILRWTVAELDGYFSGEFGWKKIGLYGICALQYINKYLVRLIVYAPNQEMSDSMIKSFVWHLDAKTQNRKPYTRRCSGTRAITAANTMATIKGFTGKLA